MFLYPSSTHLGVYVYDLTPLGPCEVNRDVTLKRDKAATGLDLNNAHNCCWYTI